MVFFRTENPDLITDSTGTRWTRGTVPDVDVEERPAVDPQDWRENWGRFHRDDGVPLDSLGGECGVHECTGRRL